MTPRSPLTLILIFTIANLVVFSVVGNFLPQKFGSYIPIRLRDQYIRSHAGAETLRPCIAFLGDSRVAFNVSGAIVDRHLPGSCSSQNYGFPGIFLDDMSRLEPDLTPKIAVISPTETMLSEPTSLLSALEQRGALLVRATLQVSWVRSLYIGYGRATALVHFATRRKMPASSGWDWSPSQKRWLSSSVQNREYVNLPTYTAEAEAMALDYFGRDTAGLADDIKKIVTSFKDRGISVILLIAPSELEFQRRSHSLGQQARWQIVREVAAKTGSPLIDCSVPIECGVLPKHFADPVHLNDAGVESYSSSLGAHIRFIMNGISYSETN